MTENITLAAVFAKEMFKMKEEISQLSAVVDSLAGIVDAAAGKFDELAARPIADPADKDALAVLTQRVAELSIALGTKVQSV